MELTTDILKEILKELVQINNTLQRQEERNRPAQRASSPTQETVPKNYPRCLRCGGEFIGVHAC